MKIERIQHPHQGTNTDRTAQKIEAQSKNVLGADAVSFDADSKRRQQPGEQKEEQEKHSSEDEAIAAQVASKPTSRSLDVVV